MHMGNLLSVGRVAATVMAATNPNDTGLDHPTVVPANYVPGTEANDAERAGTRESSADDAPRCPACGHPLADH